MRLLLDTHALIWLFLGRDDLPPVARQAIASEQNEVFVSAASAWEIATKFRKGKLSQAAFLAQEFEALIAEQGIAELSITARHARVSGLLQIANDDPFDRMIVAQALLENMAVVSNETSFDAAGIVRIWA